MHGLSNLLWKQLAEGNYNTVIDLIKANPKENLVNAVTERGSSLFMMAYEKLPSAMPLLAYIAHHPAFKLEYQQPYTPFYNHTKAIMDGNYDVIVLLANNPALLLVGNDTSYHLALNQLKEAKKKYGLIPVGSGIVALRAAQKKITNLERVVDTLRDITIRQALAANDFAPLYALDIAGGSLVKPLQDGSLPLNLLQRWAHPKLKTWFRDMTIHLALTTNDDSLFMRIKLDPLDSAEQTAHDLELVVCPFDEVFIPFLFETQTIQFIKQCCANTDFLIEVLNKKSFLATLFRKEANPEIREWVRDKAIRYAIKADLPGVLIKIDEAGADLAEPLLDGKLPGQLISNKGAVPRLVAWFKERFEKPDEKGRDAGFFSSPKQPVPSGKAKPSVSAQDKSIAALKSQGFQTFTSTSP